MNTLSIPRRIRSVRPPAAALVHRDTHAGFDENAGEVGAGELAALVAVENLRLAVSGQRQAL
jgi:hypothetical protein